MERPKHTVEKATKKQWLVIFSLLTVIIITLIIYIIPLIHTNTEQQDNNETADNESLEEPISQVEEVEEPEQFEIVDTSDLPDEYKGHPVLGKIVIDKLGIEQRIIDDDGNDSTLDLGVIRFSGPNLNENGNLSIVGHNYKGIFKELRQLQIGDSFYIVSKDGRKVDYTVTAQFPYINPYDLTHVYENNDSIMEVTLITCETRRIYKVFSKGPTY